MKSLIYAMLVTTSLAFSVETMPRAEAGVLPLQWNEQEQTPLRSTLTDRQLQDILTRIRTNADTMRRALGGAPPPGRALGNRVRQNDDLAYLIEDLIGASLHLSDHVTRRQATRTDVDDVMRRAHALDAAVASVGPGPAGRGAWANIRRDIDRLASAYSLDWNWQNPQYPGIPGSGVYQRLTGTYRIDASRSDDPQRVIEAALRSSSASNRARTRRQLVMRLDPPSVIAIDRSDRRVTIASSLAPQVTFDADGQARLDQGPLGRSLTTRATLYGDQLEVTTTGAANLDYAITFEPINGGDELQVTRRIHSDGLSQPVTLRTVYRRTADVPDWTLSERTDLADDERMTPLVPDGLTLVARLEQTVDLRTARDDDPVTLVVRNAPRPELEGATIDGYVRTTRSGPTTGVIIRLDQIQLRNGRAGYFDGVIERMAGPNGETVRYDGEQSTLGDGGDTREAIERGAIGAAVGAVMGAILGGGKGAAIGAVVGGGGAAASVLVGDGGQTQLVRGTEFTIRSRAQ